MFNIHAFLVKEYKTIFRGTVNWLPRIGEEFVIGVCIYKVENIRYLLQDGDFNTINVQLYLKQIV